MPKSVSLTPDETTEFYHLAVAMHMTRIANPSYLMNYLTEWQSVYSSKGAPARGLVCYRSLQKLLVMYVKVYFTKHLRYLYAQRFADSFRVVYFVFKLHCVNVIEIWNGLNSLLTEPHLIIVSDDIRGHF